MSYYFNALLSLRRILVCLTFTRRYGGKRQKCWVLPGSSLYHSVIMFNFVKRDRTGFKCKPRKCTMNKIFIQRKVKICLRWDLRCFLHAEPPTKKQMLISIFHFISFHFYPSGQAYSLHFFENADYDFFYESCLN